MQERVKKSSSGNQLISTQLTFSLNICAPKPQNMASNLKFLDYMPVFKLNKGCLTAFYSRMKSRTICTKIDSSLQNLLFLNAHTISNLILLNRFSITISD